MSELTEMLADAASEPYVAKHNVSVLLPVDVWQWLTRQVEELELRPAAKGLRRHTIPTYLGHLMTLYRTMHERPHRFWPERIRSYIGGHYGAFERRQVRLNLTPGNSDWYQTCNHDWQAKAPWRYHSGSRNSAIAAIVLWAWDLDMNSASRRDEPLNDGTQTQMEL